MAGSLKASSARTTSSRAGASLGSSSVRQPDDAATAYARDVVEQRVVACKWVRLACQRHLTDLERGHERGLWWDAEIVEDLRLYFLGLRHSKGEWGKGGGQPIALEPWQLFIIGSVFGWKRADGRRRFRIVYAEVARKSGKSTMLAAVGNYLAFDDDEPGAEVYAAATKRDQAKVVWLEAKRMVMRSRLRERITVLSTNLHDHATVSKFEPLGADADSLDGLNIHGALIDELHAHKTRELYDVLATAMGARRQPLLFAITTAGFNRAGVCYDQRTYVTKILEGVIAADEVFGIIFTLDDDDDWRDPAVWIKANPNLGVSVQVDELLAECQRAVEIPSARTSFLTKRLNVWVNAGSAEVDMLRWVRAETAFTLDDVAGAPCWIGVDLASRSDLAAVVAVFTRDEHVWVRSRFYLPEELVHDAAHAASAHYAGWAAAEHLTLTRGNEIDFAVIRADLEAFARTVRTCREIDFDPYNSTHLRQGLEPLARELRVELVEIPQTVKHLSGPMYAVRSLLLSGKLHHDGNPVMTWCVSNVESREDANENLFPRKAARNLKIDGYTAMLDALARALVQSTERSVYDGRGLRAL